MDVVSLCDKMTQQDNMGRRRHEKDREKVTILKYGRRCSTKQTGNMSQMGQNVKIQVKRWTSCHCDKPSTPQVGGRKILLHSIWSLNVTYSGHSETEDVTVGGCLECVKMSLGHFAGGHFVKAIAQVCGTYAGPSSF
jgi:hypothetical protein